MNLSYFTSSNRIFYILSAGIGVLVLISIILVIRGVGGGSGGQPVTLEFWGVFDDRAEISEVINAFEQHYPNTRVRYTQVPFEEYERKLIDALAAGTGPDLWMVHNTWLPKHGDKLRPAPDRIPGRDDPLITATQFRNDFVDVAFSDLVVGNAIYAIPLYVDTLALYYNRDLLNAAQIARPPQTWEEFNAAVEVLTKFDERSNIIQSGAAIGSARNINRSTDILMSLMIQSGVQMTDTDNAQATFSRSIDNQPVGERALQFYTDFTNPSKRTYTWNDSQHYSIDAFAEGRVAMSINFAHQIEILQSKNPSLNYGIASVPQLSQSDPRTYANYWAIGVSNASALSNEAWEFAAYVGSQEGARAYLGATDRPSARRDLIDVQKNDLMLGVFATQALSARSWYQADNMAIETIFADMIDDVNFNRATARDAIRNAESKVSVLMRR